MGLAVVVALWCLIGAAAVSQVIRGQYYNPNDERFKFLALKKTEASFNEARSRYSRAQKLLEQGLISHEEFEKFEVDYQYAELEYQQALLSVIFEKPKIIIDEAVKYVSEDGQKRVKLTLRNTAGGSFDIDRFESLENDSLAARLKPDELYNVYVSLKSGETVIGQPYVAKIPVLKYGEPKTTDFLLLKDLDEVIVSINYADKVEDTRIYLQKGHSAEQVAISSLQFSQEADLGSRVTYNLKLERFTSGSSAFKLAAVNLPRQITYDFVDPNTGARLTRVNFIEGITTQNLSLNLYLPERADSSVAVDRPISFYAVALDQEAASHFDDGSSGSLAPEQLSRLGGGRVRLEIIPRGRAKIELLMKKLFYEIGAGDDIVMDLRVKNGGTKDLNNVRVELSLPYDWQARIDPQMISSLLESAEQPVGITILPPSAVDVGDYQVKVKAQCMVDNRKVESEEQLVRLTVKSSSSVIGTLILILLLLALVVGLIVFGIKLTRR